jgi:ribonuclease Z
MIRTTFLGTASAKPTKDRGFPGIAVTYEGNVYLFDCGEGTQRQMMKFGVNIFRISSIFITHIHGDHTLGLPGLVRTLGLNKRTEPLRIYVPKGYEKMLERLVFYDNPKFTYKVEIVPIGTGKVLEGKDFIVSAIKLNHNVTTYGYLFEEKDKIKFLTDKCKSLGIKGTMFRELLDKGKIVVNKRVIKIKEVTFINKGKKLGYATDTRPSVIAAKAFAGADLLIHESTYGSEKADAAKEYMHSTATECASLAKKAGVKRLVMTHISARYQESDSLVVEARKVFKNSSFASDGMEILL